MMVAGLAALRLPLPPPLLLIRRSSTISNPDPNPNPNPKAYNRSILCAQKTTASASMKYAVLGAGFAGLSVAWHLLKHCPKESHMHIDIYDEVGIGGGASGASGGLLHPYSPKAKALWRGAECWKECLKLLTVAESAVQARVSENNIHDTCCCSDGSIVLRRGILRPATAEKNVEILKENAHNCLQSCILEYLNGDDAQCLVPNLNVPFDSAIYMPLAMNIHPKRYVQALFLACQNIANNASALDSEEREIKLHKQSVSSLHELSGEYDAVIVCLGAKSTMLPELSGKLPLRLCRGVISQLQLPTNNISDEYHDHSPSILSDAWLAFQSPHSVLMGSTWDWNSNNYSSSVTSEESSSAYQYLLPKASKIYPAIKKWDLVGARAGLRAMPPLTPLGSLPLLGCVDDFVVERGRCRFWFVGGLGSRGILYHGLIGKLMAKAVVLSDEGEIPMELTSWKNARRR